MNIFAAIIAVWFLVSIPLAMLVGRIFAARAREDEMITMLVPFEAD